MNVVCIAGNLTKTPELRTTQSNGKKVTSFTVAINEGKDKTEFVNCVAWEKTAEVVTDYCTKGSRVALTGRLQTRKYADKDGVEKYSTEVIVSQLDLPPRGESKPEKPEPRVKEELEDEIPF